MLWQGGFVLQGHGGNARGKPHGKYPLQPPALLEHGRRSAHFIAKKHKKPLQGWPDIGILLYAPNSRFVVVTNHPRCFSAINGR
jgi:hypothetical protein